MSQLAQVEYWYVSTSTYYLHLNDMAPSDTRHMTSLDSCDAQDPDPMAEGSGIVTTSGFDEDSGHNSKSGDKPKRHERPKRPRRPKTRPPSNPVRHQLTIP